MKIKTALVLSVVVNIALIAMVYYMDALFVVPDDTTPLIIYSNGANTSPADAGVLAAAPN